MSAVAREICKYSIHNKHSAFSVHIKNEKRKNDQLKEEKNESEKSAKIYIYITCCSCQDYCNDDSCNDHTGNYCNNFRTIARAHIACDKMKGVI